MAENGRAENWSRLLGRWQVPVSRSVFTDTGRHPLVSPTLASAVVHASPTGSSPYSSPPPPRERPRELHRPQQGLHGRPVTQKLRRLLPVVLPEVPARRQHVLRLHPTQRGNLNLRVERPAQPQQTHRARTARGRHHRQPPPGRRRTPKQSAKRPKRLRSAAARRRPAARRSAPRRRIRARPPAALAVPEPPVPDDAAGDASHVRRSPLRPRDPRVPRGDPEHDVEVVQDQKGEVRLARVVERRAKRVGGASRGRGREPDAPPPGTTAAPRRTRTCGNKPPRPARRRLRDRRGRPRARDAARARRGATGVARDAAPPADEAEAASFSDDPRTPAEAGDALKEGRWRPRALVRRALGRARAL